jgi:PadR family transcriptional regulator PadR
MTDMLHGTLEVLILKTLLKGSRHGYAIARWLEEATDAVVPIEEGSMYPALYRMEKRGWISAEWGVSDLGRRAKVYSITAKGRRQLTSVTEQWAKFSAAVSNVLLKG